MSPSLIKIDAAAAVLGKSAPQIFDLLEGGSLSEAGLLWVFNLAHNRAGTRRDLRLWLPELKACVAGQPRQYHSQDIRQTLAQILPGNRQRFNAGDVDCLFQIRPRTRLDFGTELPGYRVAGRTIYARSALESFLIRRWLGAATGRVGHD